MITTNQLRDALNETTNELIDAIIYSEKILEIPINETYFPAFCQTYIYGEGAVYKVQVKVKIEKV